LLVTISFSGSDRMDNVLKDHRWPTQAWFCVQSHDMVYKVSRDILYSVGWEDSSCNQRSTIVERWLARSSSRTKVWQ